MVTGSGGFLGSALVNGLSKFNYIIYALDINFSYKLDNLSKIKKIKINLLNKNSLNKIDNIDVFIHCAALTRPVKTKDNNNLLNINNKLTLNALELAKLNAAKAFFFISSTSVYRYFNSITYNERSKVRGSEPYSKSKLFGEKFSREFCKKNKIKHTVLRIGNIYSGNEFKKWSRSNTSLFQNWLNASKKRKIMKTNSFNTFRDWTFVNDISIALHNIIKKRNKFKLLNLVSPFIIKDIDLMRLIDSNAKHIEIEGSNLSNNSTVTIYRNKLSFKNWTSPKKVINLIKKYMKKLKILLVGYGPRGKIWSKVVHKNKQTILVGICDINQNLKNRSPVKFYSKLDNAILDTNPDAVILSTPPFNRMKDLKCAQNINCQY